MATEINRILVLGLGTMGNGIAHTAAQVGYEVHAFDLQQEFIDRGISTIEKNLGRQAKRGKLDESEINTIMSRIKGFTDLKPAAEGVDFVIEAVFEDIKVKADLYAELKDLIGPDVIIASNT
ncbi:MAG: 3-hydroxyacyl-CoA dehydrogenase family protein, partial [Candidatus Kariarchaeaceae archaeon]